MYRMEFSRRKEAKKKKNETKNSTHTHSFTHKHHISALTLYFLEISIPQTHRRMDETTLKNRNNFSLRFFVFVVVVVLSFCPVFTLCVSVFRFNWLKNCSISRFFSASYERIH